MDPAVIAAARSGGSEPSLSSLVVSNDSGSDSRTNRDFSVSLEAFRAGRREALDAVYRNYQPIVTRYVRALARRRGNMELAQRAAVEDLVQEVFLRAFSGTARAGYDDAHEFVPFLLTIAKNRFRDLSRRERREEPWEHETLHAHLCSETRVLTLACADASTALEPAALLVLSSYLRALPEELRRVYEQRFAREESQESAADALGLSRAQLRTREKRIKTGLRFAIRAAGIDLCGSSSQRALKPSASSATSRKK